MGSEVPFAKEFPMVPLIRTLLPLTKRLFLWSGGDTRKLVLLVGLLAVLVFYVTMRGRRGGAVDKENRCPYLSVLFS